MPKLTRQQTTWKNKFGADLWVYRVNRQEVGVTYIQVKKGHFEEFANKKSTFSYYIIKGSGTFYLNRKAMRVKATDLIVAPPKTKIYYKGTMQMLLVTTPAWRAKNEVHVRYIKQ